MKLTVVRTVFTTFPKCNYEIVMNSEWKGAVMHDGSIFFPGCILNGIVILKVGIRMY